MICSLPRLSLQSFAVAVLAGLVWVPVAHAAPQIAITWNRSLAFSEDQGEYEKRLRSFVAQALGSVDEGLSLKAPDALNLTVMTPDGYAQQFPRKAQWAGAHYYRGAVYFNGGRRLGGYFLGTLAHEIVHAYVDAGGKGHLVPAWLNEGNAEYFKYSLRGLRHVEANQRQELMDLVKAGRLSPIKNAFDASTMAYLRSWAAVLFLREKKGRAEMEELLKLILGGLPPAKALDRVYNLSAERFDREFEAWVRVER